jgi:hypothetical protein
MKMLCWVVNHRFLWKTEPDWGLVLVHGIQQGQPVVVGVAALIPAREHLVVANPEAVHAISDALLEKCGITSRIAA